MKHFVFNLNWSLERYSAERNGADNFLISFIFLLASSLSLILDVARLRAYEKQSTQQWNKGDWGIQKSTYSEVE